MSAAFRGGQTSVGVLFVRFGTGVFCGVLQHVASIMLGPSRSASRPAALARWTPSLRWPRLLVVSASGCPRRCSTLIHRRSGHCHRRLSHWRQWLSFRRICMEDFRELVRRGRDRLSARRGLHLTPNGAGRAPSRALPARSGTRPAGHGCSPRTGPRPDGRVPPLLRVGALDAAHGFFILRVPVSPDQPSSPSLTDCPARGQLAGARNPGPVRPQARRPSQSAPLRAARRLAGGVSAAQGLRLAHRAAAVQGRAAQVPRGRGRRRVSGAGGTGARGHHRAGPLPLQRGRRAGALPADPALLHAQGHREAVREYPGDPRRPPGGEHFRRFQLSRMRPPFATPSSGPPDVEAPPRARALRTVCLELERIYNHIADIGAIAPTWPSWSPMRTPCGSRSGCCG